MSLEKRFTAAGAIEWLEAVAAIAGNVAIEELAYSIEDGRHELRFAWTYPGSDELHHLAYRDEGPTP